MDFRKQETEVASYIGKTLREKFGKGPEAVFVTISIPFITIYIKNFISPIEQALLNQEDSKTVQNTRELLMQTLEPEIKAYLKVLTGHDISEFYYDWDLSNKSGTFLAVTDGEINATLKKGYPEQDRIHKKVIIMSEEVQKAPEKISSYLINERLLLVIREGILVRIEKELINQGYEKVLKTTKRILEKSYLPTGEFERILEQKVTDIFVDWDFTRDKSIIWLVLKAK